MLFNSWEFIFIFLPLALLSFFLLARFKLTKLAIGSLVFFSLAFYAYWDIRYLPLLIGSIIFNFIFAHLIWKTHDRKILAIGISINLLFLFYFKYTSFFIQILNDVLKTSFVIPSIILPLGISFFTFTQIAYLIDLYRREASPYNLLTYSLFVTIFPHLIAGPILYHKDMIPQFSKTRNFIFSHKNLALGLSFFIIGLFKKVAIADLLSPFVKAVFDNSDKISFFDAWKGSLAYTFQLYFDFSGYSEMAIGLGLMFNFRLPINFNSPYRATSIIDFWRRWHMTLSAFLKNYLYIPLGGNRHGKLQRYRNLMITMMLGGIWHGADWTFLLWGTLHGFYLAINHFWKQLNYTMPVMLSWCITFLSVVIAWVFFRCHSIHQAFNIISAMAGFHSLVLPHKLLSIFPFLAPSGAVLAHSNLTGGLNKYLIFCFILIWIPSTHILLEKYRADLKWALFIGFLLIICLFKLGQSTEFLYFQF